MTVRWRVKIGATNGTFWGQSSQLLCLLHGKRTHSLTHFVPHHVLQSQPNRIAIPFLYAPASLFKGPAPSPNILSPTPPSTLLQRHPATAFPLRSHGLKTTCLQHFEGCRMLVLYCRWERPERSPGVGRAFKQRSWWGTVSGIKIRALERIQDP